MKLQWTYVQGDNPYGAFHQHYRIDGKLFAVGVIDMYVNILMLTWFVLEFVIHMHIYIFYIAR